MKDVMKPFEVIIMHAKTVAKVFEIEIKPETVQTDTSHKNMNQ